jgi:hypothetical protein
VSIGFRGFIKAARRNLERGGEGKRRQPERKKVGKREGEREAERQGGRAAGKEGSW